jgi:hypothetical protein
MGVSTDLNMRLGVITDTLSLLSIHNKLCKNVKGGEKNEKTSDTNDFHTNTRICTM